MKKMKTKACAVVTRSVVRFTVPQRFARGEDNDKNNKTCCWQQNLSAYHRSNNDAVGGIPPWDHYWEQDLRDRARVNLAPGQVLDVEWARVEWWGMATGTQGWS